MRREQIDAALAAELVAEQFPHWAELPVSPVAFSGWDNRTFRLGDTMTVRMPSAADYAGSVEKELTWLPRLAPALPLPIPVPVAAGAPSARYPWPWSVRRWIEGSPAATATIAEPVVFAEQLAGFLRALRDVDPTDGPAAGPENFHRGGDLAAYDDETRRATARLTGVVDAGAVTAMWEAALAARWAGPPVWFHGDVAAGNLLLDASGRLCAVIDFGQFGIGDAACDLAIAWTLLRGRAREAFRVAMAVDEPMWVRGRGWALWKALSTIMAGDVSAYFIDQAYDVLRELRVLSVSR
jgi:aminoglycoside phosphotransferase (APT) family kinase protein